MKRDDALDALVAAITARLGKTDLSAIPVHPEKDARELVMEMVYYLQSGSLA